MLDKDSPHKKLQELCDCYAETDPVREMAMLSKDPDKDEAALKWLALAVLHGVDRNAEEISLHIMANSGVRVVARYKDNELPAPGREIGGKVVDAVRRITHIETDQGDIPLAIGIRESSIEVLVEVARQDDEETITLKFGK